MARVRTPSGEVLEGVTGDALEYYRGEGYAIVEDEAEVKPFPVSYVDGEYVPPVEAPASVDATALGLSDDQAQALQGQYFGMPGEVRTAVEHPADGTMSPPVGSEPVVEDVSADPQPGPKRR